jgi:hypothetical protein
LAEKLTFADTKINEVLNKFKVLEVDLIDFREQKYKSNNKYGVIYQSVSISKDKKILSKELEDEEPLKLNTQSRIPVSMRTKMKKIEYNRTRNQSKNKKYRINLKKGFDAKKFLDKR